MTIGVRRMDRYTGSKSNKSSDAAKWLEMYGSRLAIVDQRGSGVVHVPRAALSVCGGMQLSILARAIGGTNNREKGLLAQLLLAHPPRRAKRWTDCDVDD